MMLKAWYLTLLVLTMIVGLFVFILDGTLAILSHWMNLLSINVSDALDDLWTKLCKLDHE